MAEKVEVLICGSGSAGICAAAWLARCGIRCKILESRTGPLEIGQADGVQCRTVEVFESFNLAEELLREAYHVLEVSFWESNADGELFRLRMAADTAPGLSHQPHVILNQARVNGILLEAMQRWSGQEVDYGNTVKSVEVNSDSAIDPESYPVRVTAQKDGKEQLFDAKYVLACDGAHSAVRKSLGFRMIGDTTDAVWGVMDIYPKTNFPDYRKKVTIRTKVGNILIVPREGGSMVRFYIELPAGTIAKAVKLEDLQKKTRQILLPYQIDFAETVWWSAYSIGQRLADFFSKDNRVFLTGDACHTHSPKAGQGMNTSLQDGYNIGWKLVTILKGQAGPELLRTYNVERERVAANLIDFDRSFTKLFSSNNVSQNGDSTGRFAEQFIKAGSYTAGLTARYDDSSITSSKGSIQDLAHNIKVGMRLPSAQVVRFCDAKAMHLVKALPADGRWRLLVFGGNIRDTSMARRLYELGQYLDSQDGPVRRYTPVNADIDSFIEPIVVLSGRRLDLQQDQIPEYFWPVTGRWRMRDLHKVYFDDESYNSGHGMAYKFYGVDPARGALAIIRPDQYVSLVTAVENHKAVGDFMAGFARPSNKML